MDALITKFLETWSDSPHEDIVTKISESITQGSGTLVEVLEGVEGLFLSSELDRVDAATNLLVGVMGKLPQSLLTPEQLTFLVSFFISRASTFTLSLQSTLGGFVVLLRQAQLTLADTSRLTLAALNLVAYSRQRLSVQQAVYDCLLTVAGNRVQVLDELLEDLVAGLIAVAEEEKDPRLLLKLFALVSHVSCRPGLSDAQVLELFHVAAAYFPVQYEPPPHSPVTKAQLVTALRTTLTCSHRFLPPLLPLLREKMTSQDASAREDAFLTLAAACAAGHTLPLSDASSVLACVRAVVTNGDVTSSVDEVTSDRVLAAALTAVTGVVGSVGESEKAVTLIQDFSAELCHTAHQPGTVSMLCAAVAGSRAAAQCVCGAALCGDGELGTVAVVLRAVLARADGVSLVPEHVLTTSLKRMLACVAVSVAPAAAEGGVRAACRLFTGRHPYWQSFAGHTAHFLISNESYLTEHTSLRESLIHCLSLPNPDCCKVLKEILLPACVKSPEVDLESGVPQIAFDAVVSCCVGSEAVQLVLETLWSDNKDEIFAPQRFDTMAQVVDANRSDSSLPEVLQAWGGVEKPYTPAHACAEAALHTLHSAVRLLCSVVAALPQCDAVVLANTLCTQLREANTIPDAAVVLLLRGLLLHAGHVSGVSAVCRDTLLTHVATHDTALPLIACVLNKLTPNSVEENAWIAALEDLNSSPRVVVYVLKALMLRGSPRAGAWLDRLVEITCLGSVEAARSFTLLLQDQPELRAECGVTRRLLYAQHVFARTLTTFSGRLTTARGSPRRCILTAVCGMLALTDTVILLQYTEQLVPILVECLRYNIKMPTIDQSESQVEDSPITCKDFSCVVPTLVKLLEGSDDTEGYAGEAGDGDDAGVCALLLPHLGSLLPDLTALACAGNLAADSTPAWQPMAVRRGSAVCVARMARLPPPHTLPYRAQVLRELRPALRDAKLRVREAVGDARVQWMLGAAPLE